MRIAILFFPKNGKNKFASIPSAGIWFFPFSTSVYNIILFGCLLRMEPRTEIKIKSFISTLITIYKQPNYGIQCTFR